MARKKVTASDPVGDLIADGNGERKKASASKTDKKLRKRVRATAAPPLLHSINIRDTDANWLKWGRLVLSWVEGNTARPEDVRTLKEQMRDFGLGDEDFSVDGDDDREVQVNDYGGSGPIIIPVPTEAMIDRDKAELIRLAALPSGQRKYPTPRFYGLIYGNQPKVDMDQVEMFRMALRRLGEYVINECM